MAPDRSELLELLNTAFEMEYNEVFLYLREAELFRRKIVNGEKLGEVFDAFSLMELRHADIIAAKIVELKGAPRWNFGAITVNPSLRETLAHHVHTEAQAYEHYSKLLEKVRGTDFEIVIKGIRENEREHCERVASIVRKLKEE